MPVDSIPELVAQLEDETNEIKVEEPAPGSAFDQSKVPDVTVEDASERLGPKVLRALEQNFNGSLTQVRTPDEKDLLF